MTELARGSLARIAFDPEPGDEVTMRGGHVTFKVVGFITDMHDEKVSVLFERDDKGTLLEERAASLENWRDLVTFGAASVPCQRQTLG